MKYRRARQTAWRTIADETVLLDLDKKQMYGLNPAAAVIWQALDEAEGVNELLGLTAGEGEPAFGEPEMVKFLDQLVALGLAEERPPAELAALPEAAAVEPSEGLEPPAILWREDVEQIAGTCAMFPSQNPLCNQAPFG